MPYKKIPNKNCQLWKNENVAFSELRLLVCNPVLMSKLADAFVIIPNRIINHFITTFKITFCDNVRL